MAQQNGWKDVEVKVDIKAQADCLQARRYPIPNAITIADDVYLLALMFGTCTFSFGHRTFNRCCADLAN